MTMARKAPRRRPRAAHQHPAASETSIIYGWHSALAAIRNPDRTITRVIATRNALQRLSEEGVSVQSPQEAEPREIDALAGADAVHQGIVVMCQPLADHDLEEFEEARLILVLDQITDPHNVGAILRSAAAFGAAAIVMTERHGAAESAVLAKAASGGLEHVALVRVKNLSRALTSLGELGFLRIGLDSGFAESIEATPRSPKVAVVLGAEGRGLRRLTRDHCDRLVRLDVPGPISSLNVSNAAAVALYALHRAAVSDTSSDGRNSS